jgi:hypothetical protein
MRSAKHLRLVKQSVLTPVSLSSHFALRSCDLEQVEAIEPHANDGSPILKPCWSYVCRIERALERPVFRDKEAGHGAVLGHGTQEVWTLLISEQIVGGVAYEWSGRNQQCNGHYGYPWRLARLQGVASERLLQDLQDPDESLYHPREVYEVRDDVTGRA